MDHINEKHEQIINDFEIKEFEDLGGLDLSDKDFTNVSIETLQTIDFDTLTKWPSKDKLPKGFNPENILKEGKNPGLGIRKLHEQGIDGHGVTVAIIDQALSSKRGEFTVYDEYATNIINYKEFGMTNSEEISLHGTAVTSLLVGKNCGVAPGAKLVYRAVQSGRDFNNEADALLDIIELNKALPPRDKVRIVSCSIGYKEKNPEPNLDRWIEAIKKAEETGIIVSDVGERTGVDYIGGGASGDKENIDNYNIALFLTKKEDEELKRLVSEGDVEGIMKKMKVTRKDEVTNLSDEELRKIIEKRLNEIKGKKEWENTVIVPSDYRTMSSKNRQNEYVYNGKGGMSWAVPYLTGIFALALQVNPDLKKEQIAEIINKTAATNKKGLKVISPIEIIDEVKKMGYVKK